MTFLRKLEVGCGAVTALLGFSAAAQMLNTNVDVARRLERRFSLFQELFGALVLYVLPGLLVGIGSYIHASKLRSWALPMLLIGASYVVIIAVLLVFNLAFYTANLLFWLNFLLAVMAILTAIVSLVVRFTDRR